MIIELETGNRLEVPDGSTQEQIGEIVDDFAARQGGRDSVKPAQNQPETIPKETLNLSGKILGGLSEIGQGATFDTADEIGAGLAAPFLALKDKTNLSEAYDKGLANVRGLQKRFEEENPKTAIAANIVGGVASLGGLGGATKAGAALTNSLRNGNTAMRVGKGVAAGAASGGAYGFGSGEGGAGERLESAGKGAMLGGAVGGAIPAVGAAANKLLTKSIIPNADQLRAKAGELYKLAEQKGGVLKPEFTNKFVDQVESLKPQTEIGKIVGGDTPFTKFVEKISNIRDKPITLDAAQELDELLGEAIDNFTDMGRLTKQGKKLLDIQSTFRNMIAEADDAVVVGGKEGFQALKDGRKLWATSRKLADIERIVTRAELTDNPATGIKTGFRTLLNNPTRLKGFNEAERKAIKKAAESGVVTDALRIMGSRLLPIVTGASGGGLGATAAASALSTASRGAASKLQVGKAKKLADLIALEGARAGNIPIETTNKLTHLLGRRAKGQLPVTPLVALSEGVREKPSGRPLQVTIRPSDKYR